MAKRPDPKIDLKVGTAAIAVLATLVLVFIGLGGIRFGSGFVVYVDYDDALGLAPGAPVNIAGLPSGEVGAVEYLNGEFDEELGRPVFVRIEIQFDEDQRDQVREDSVFVVAQSGFIGDPYIEMFGLDSSSPQVPEGHVYLGVEPHTFADVSDRAYDTMESIRAISERIAAMAGGRETASLDETINRMAREMGTANEEFLSREDRINEFIADLDEGTQGGVDRASEIISDLVEGTDRINQLGIDVNDRIGNGRDLERSLRDAERTSGEMADGAETFFVEANEFIGDMREALVGREDEIADTFRSIEETSEELADGAEQVYDYVDNLNTGDSQVSELLRDDIIFLDAQEYVRDLRIRPWRILFPQ